MYNFVNYSRAILSNGLKLFALFLLLNSKIASGQLIFANSNFHQVLTTSAGLTNISITENASSLSSADGSANTSEAASTSASVISIDINYEFMNYTNKSYYIRALAPLLSSDGSGVFLGGVGANFYLNSLSSMFSYNDAGTSLTFIPSMRFYWGPAAGIGFVVYNTETAKKSDLIFDLEIHGGGVLNFKRDWGLRGEAAVSRGTGISSSTIGIKIFFGLSYYLEK